MTYDQHAESTLLTALAFVRRGFAVFPVNWPVTHDGPPRCSCGSDSRGRPCISPAKHPFGKLATNGLLSATIETGVVKHWWGYQAPQANLGLCTDKLVVIDVDPRHGGDESLAVLEREHEFPPTWRVLTGGGGEHVLFAARDGVTVKSFYAQQMKDSPLGPGIDVRSRGGYVVAPPSRHISGRVYAWSVDHHPRDTPLAPAPDWLIERLTARSAAATTADGTPTAEPIASDKWAQLTRQSVGEYRDMAATRIAGHLFRHSCDYQLVLGLLHAWNSSCCKPPLGYHELESIVGRIATREAERIEQQLRSDGQ
jgi:Bifunctional DNA primase/polymerase, N-terminal/Primase C terminal 1 (PriCT-1)